VTRGSGWRPTGFAIHALNGALFGLAYQRAQALTGADPRRLAVGLALAEHAALWPLSRLIDRFHPARGEAGVPRLIGNRRAFAQATLRHAVFGVVLGRLAAT
jgi:hypothetical protein